MFKKFTVFFISLVFLLAVPTSAKEGISLKPEGNFYIYGEDNAKICEIAGIDDIDRYCEERNIKYLAVNEKNTRQISVLVYESDFSSGVINLSSLSDQKITQLIPSIIGLDNVSGEIVDKNGQKFIKTSVKSQDSGGEYVNIQYYTVAAKKVYVLNFYTLVNDSTDYAEKTFESFTADDFNLDAKEADRSVLIIVIGIAFTVFAVSSLIILFTIIKDIVKFKKCIK